MNEDPQTNESPDADNTLVATAQAGLEAARKSQRVGSIAVAQTQLASAYAKSGLHAEAVAEYEQLMNYLQMADSEGRQGIQRRLGVTRPAAPPQRTNNVDLGRLETLARLNQAESMLILGRHDDAQAGLRQVAPMCRGFRRKLFRKKLIQLQLRLDANRGEVNANPASDDSPHDSESGPEIGPDDADGVASDLHERLSAADATLRSGDPRTAAREALGVVSDSEDDDHCRAQARQVLGMALDAMGKPAESLATMQLSLADYLAADDLPQAANLAVPVAVRLAATGERTEAIALIRKCLAGTEESIPDPVRYRLMTDLGSLLDQDDAHAEARSILESAVENAADPATRADAEHGLAVSLGDDVAADAEQSVEALTLLDAAKSAYSELGHLRRVAGCEHEAAALLGRLSSFPAAEARYQKAKAAYEELGPDQIDSMEQASQIADCTRNILGAQSRVTADPTLFHSGGHTMSHWSAGTETVSDGAAGGEPAGDETAGGGSAGGGSADFSQTRDQDQ